MENLNIEIGDVRKIDYVETYSVQNRNSSLEFTILPYFCVVEEDGLETQNIFCNHSVNDYISPFSFDFKKIETVTNQIKNCLSTETFGALTVDDETIENFSHFVEVKAEGEIKGFFVFIFLGEKQDLVYGLNVIESYIEKYKENIKRNCKIETFAKNLVYIPSNRLYELCDGGTYAVIDEEGEELNFNVSEGIPFDPEIRQKYKKRAGDIPFSIINSQRANSPYNSEYYSSIGEVFSTFFVLMANLLYIDSLFINPERLDYE